MRALRPRHPFESREVGRLSHGGRAIHNGCPHSGPKDDVPSSQLALRVPPHVEEPRRSPSREPDLLQFAASRVRVEPYGIARTREERNGWILNTLEWTRIEDVEALVEEQVLCSQADKVRKLPAVRRQGERGRTGQGGSRGRVDDELVDGCSARGLNPRERRPRQPPAASADRGPIAQCVRRWGADPGCCSSSISIRASPMCCSASLGPAAGNGGTIDRWREKPRSLSIPVDRRNTAANVRYGRPLETNVLPRTSQTSQGPDVRP